MASYDQDLLDASRCLLRQPGERGRLSTARIRRSISTTYYALFHFLTEESGYLLIGTGHYLRPRRRIFSRMFSHQGLRNAARTVRSATIEPHVQDFLTLDPNIRPVQTPAFARSMATVFIQAQIQRNEADYNLNWSVSESEATDLIERVEQAIKDWMCESSAAAKEFKRAICLLMLLKGNLRRSDGE